MFRRVFLATAVASSFAFSALADGHSKDIIDTAVDAGGFTTLTAALEAAGPPGGVSGAGGPANGRRVRGGAAVPISLGGGA